MPFSRSGLTALFVDTVARPGKYYDLHGLYLRVSASGRRYWAQRITIGGRRRTLGLGCYPSVSLRVAREAALAHRRAVRAGDDPFELRRRALVRTFADAARRVHALWTPKWSSPRTAPSWIRSLEMHVFPAIGDRPITELAVSDFVAVLGPIGSTRANLACTLRRRIALVMLWAVAEGHRTDNPAGDFLSSVLPRGSAPPVHHAALPHAEVGRALARLRAVPGYPAPRLALEFMVLTAARSGEVRGASWSEFDRAGSTWTVPAARMKVRVEHRVPLSDAALRVLEQAHTLFPGSLLVFPARAGCRLHDAPLSKLLRDLQIPAVPHGFRSSFRDWCGETGVAREVAEACLAHVVGSKVEAAYARSDLFDRRVVVMEGWARYLARGE